MRVCLLGIDVGTSSAKAGLFDATGKLYGLGQINYNISSPRQGWAEQDPELWWRSVVAAIKIATSHVSGAGNIKIEGIGLSGQMHGLVVLDRDLKVLRPSIIWADQRSLEEVADYNHIIGKKALAAKTANPAATGFLGASLLWLKKNEPDIYKKIRWVLLPKDYIRFLMTGKIATDTTDASSTLLFETAKRQWSEELCRMLNLETYYLPPCYEPWDLAGVLSNKAAIETGLNSGVPVALGGGDQPMQALGNGIFEPGMVSVTIGTGGQVFTPVKDAIYDPGLRTNTFCHSVPQTWNIMGAMLAAGLSLKWFCKQILGYIDFKESDKAAAEVPAGSEGLLFLPYLAGERTPHMDPMARGAFIGLSLRHTRAHMIRAVMEGVVFALGETLKIFNEIGLPINSIIASGGGAYSPLWRQMMADVLDCTIKITKAREQACLGAALTAGKAAGVYTDIFDACKKATTAPADMEKPDYKNVERYKVISGLYKEAYESNKNLFHTLTKLS